MALRHSQRGVTILQVMMFTLTSAIVSIPIVNIALGRLVQGEFNGAVTAAEGIAQAVEGRQRSVTNTTIDPVTGVYTYTFGGRQANFTDISVLNAETGKEFPLLSPYNTAFEYRGNGAISEARFDIPTAQLQEIQVPSTVSLIPSPTPGFTTVLVSALRSPQEFRKGKLEMIKREVYLETTR